MSRFHTVEVGDEVRSYDFPWDLERHPACYVEGTVERIAPAGSADFAFGCDRYVIRVRRRVLGGEQIAVETQDPYVYPPVNGTPSMIEDSNGVIRVSELPPEQRSVPNPVQADLSEVEARILTSLTPEEQEAAKRGEPPPQPTAAEVENALRNKTLMQELFLSESPTGRYSGPAHGPITHELLKPTSRRKK